MRDISSYMCPIVPPNKDNLSTKRETIIHQLSTASSAKGELHHKIIIKIQSRLNYLQYQHSRNPQSLGQLLYVTEGTLPWQTILELLRFPVPQKKRS